MTIDEMIAVLQAAKEGREVQRQPLAYNGPWFDCALAAGVIEWDFMNYRYRVKPEPKMIWVNEYADGSVGAYNNFAGAKVAAAYGAIRAAVPYREVVE